LSLLLKISALLTLKLHHQSWRLTSFRDVVAATRAVAVVGCAEVALALVISTQLPVPRSVIPLSIVLGALGLFALRALSRLVYTNRGIRRALLDPSPRCLALIIGAGEEGHLVVREMLRHPTARMLPVAMLDDNRRLQGLRVYGVPVVGSVGDLPDILRESRADEVVIAIASADGALIRRVRALVAEVDADVPTA
jgi:FlaA1/EpsC-like NDP-sugar epimerase